MKNGKPVKKVKQKSKAKEQNTGEIKIGRNTVKITNRQKLYWPEEGLSKGMLIDYYQDIAEYLLPFLKDRPQSLKRNPNGIKDNGFFHKDAGEKAPSFVKSFKVHAESTNKEIDYILCNDKATLAYLNNLGCIELNPWHSTIKKPGNPDYMIIDIDPSDKNNFDQVIEVTRAFKKLLDNAGAKSFCKTSGSTGIHIYVPMGKKYEYEEVKNFAQLLCIIVSELLPDLTTMERNLKKRGNKKIYLDYLQNRKSQTISSVYSVRPKKGATVSMPLHWKEVKKGLQPTDFTIHNAAKRIRKMPEIFRGVLGPATNISTCLKKLKNSYGEYLPR
ncbi:MAG: non-homologous end-joining DNA ligase [Ferruginibacter sp.]